VRAGAWGPRQCPQHPPAARAARLRWCLLVNLLLLVNCGHRLQTKKKPVPKQWPGPESSWHHLSRNDSSCERGLCPCESQGPHGCVGSSAARGRRAAMRCSSDALRRGARRAAAAWGEESRCGLGRGEAAAAWGEEKPLRRGARRAAAAWGEESRCGVGRGEPLRRGERRNRCGLGRGEAAAAWGEESHCGQSARPGPSPCPSPGLGLGPSSAGRQGGRKAGSAGWGSRALPAGCLLSGDVAGNGGLCAAGACWPSRSLGWEREVAVVRCFPVRCV